MRATCRLSSMYLCCLLLTIATPLVADEPYARPELLVVPAALPELTSKPRVVLLDARPASEYVQGHLIGARNVDAASWAKNFRDGSDAEGWSRRIAELGIERDSTVVIYDAVANKDAARVWWILRYWGVEDARILNGGFTGATAEGLAQERDTPQPTASKFVATPHDERLATKAELLASLKGGKLQIVDARSEAEHCGLDSLTNRRAGAIPGSKHLDWVDLVDQQTKQFKPAAEIAKMFLAAGIDPHKPTAAHCQSGGRSSVMVFALELMGAEQTSNYYSSWGEWGNADDTPIDRPAAKESNTP